MPTFGGTTGNLIVTDSNLDYLIPYVRMRIGDMNPSTYRYSDDWIRTSLVASVELLTRWLNNRYLVNDDNDVYRNPLITDWIYDEATYGVIQPPDEQVIVLMAAYIMLNGSMENSAWDISSWRDNEISFSNLESSRSRNATLQRLWDEIMVNLLPPTKRLAKPIKQSLPGFKNNDFEIGNVK